MFYAGIDVAMDKHDCVILDANGKCFIEVFTFKNSRDGLPLFLWLKPLPYITYLPSTSWCLFRYAIIKVLFIRFAFLHFHAFSS